MARGKQFSRAPGSLSSHFHPGQTVLPVRCSRIVTHTRTCRILMRTLLPASSSKPMCQSHPRKPGLVAFFRQQRHESLDSPPLSSNLWSSARKEEGKSRANDPPTTCVARANKWLEGSRSSLWQEPHTSSKRKMFTGSTSIPSIPDELEDIQKTPEPM